MQLLAEMGQRLTDALPNVAVGIGILLASWLAANLLRRLVVRHGSRLAASRKDVVSLAASACRFTVLILGAITGLATMGLNVSALVAGLGLTGFALGFALRDALSNLLSGVLLLIYRPFGSGDWISVAGCEGEVTEINLRYTVIAKDTDTFLIPNSILFNNTVRVSHRHVRSQDHSAGSEAG